MPTYHHDLNGIVANLGDFQLTEWSDDGLSWEADEDKVAVMQGARGAVMVSEMFDNVATVEFSIVRGSPNRAVIDALLNQFFAVSILDANSNTFRITAPSARIQKRPSIEKPKELGALVIQVKLFNGVVKYGDGNLVVGA